MDKKPPSPAAPGGDCPQPALCPLNEVGAGTVVRIKQLDGSPELNGRLRELGFCEEQRVKLLMKHTNVICQVCNARLGISSQVAKSILVERIPAAPEKKRAA